MCAEQGCLSGCLGGLGQVGSWERPHTRPGRGSPVRRTGPGHHTLHCRPARVAHRCQLMGSPPLGQWFPCGGKFTLKNLVTIILFYINMRNAIPLIIQITHVNTNSVIHAGNHRRRGRFLTKSGVCLVPRHSLYPTRRGVSMGRERSG